MVYRGVKIVIALFVLFNAIEACCTYHSTCQLSHRSCQRDDEKAKKKQKKGKTEKGKRKQKQKQKQKDKETKKNKQKKQK